ncbi:MAG: helix-turn-helix domain-containing protein [Firmicutes bacterium]|nr:helix-turn-helix domain-containing protein [Bacillota bacterium]
MRRKNSYTEFGQWLRIELIKRNITAKELAELAGIDHRVVSDVMIGRNKSHQQELKQALQQYDERPA